jgi:HD-GYP domain-containing protein (c-di-GMP phosphodiesterase class II)
MQDDVYAHDTSRLLVRAGTKLNDALLQRVKQLNSNRPTVYLSGLPLTPLALPQEEMEKRRKALEGETGYSETAHETVELLTEVTKSKSLEPELLRTVSHGLSRRLDDADPAVILSLVNALAPVDEYLQRHCINTALLNGLMGKWMGLPKEAVSRLALIGLLHDCGKALMPASILKENGKLTIVEYEVIKTHPQHSYELLGEFPEDLRMAARGHHEKINGSGYPDHLTGDSIPVESRITAVSDIYDALVARRAYKDALSPFSAMAILKQARGTELDRRFVDVFVRNMPLDLMGRQVLLSDGRVAYVSEIDAEDIEFPVVSAHGEDIKTNPNLYCVSMF